MNEHIESKPPRRPLYTIQEDWPNHLPTIGERELHDDQFTTYGEALAELKRRLEKRRDEADQFHQKWRARITKKLNEIVFEQAEQKP